MNDFLKNTDWRNALNHVMSDTNFLSEYRNRGALRVDFKTTIYNFFNHMYSECDSPALWYASEMNNGYVYYTGNVCFDIQGIFDNYCNYLDFLEGKN